MTIREYYPANTFREHHRTIGTDINVDGFAIMDQPKLAKYTVHIGVFNNPFYYLKTKLEQDTNKQLQLSTVYTTYTSYKRTKTSSHLLALHESQSKKENIQFVRASHASGYRSSTKLSKIYRFIEKMNKENQTYFGHY